MRSVLAAILMLAPLPAQASTWWWISGNPKGQLYIDQDSVTRSGDLAEGTVWLFTPQLMQGVASVRIHYRFNCADTWYSSLDYNYYGPGGSFMFKEASKSADTHRTPAEGGLDQHAFTFACTGPQARDQKVADPVADAARIFTASGS